MENKKGWLENRYHPGVTHKSRPSKSSFSSCWYLEPNMFVSFGDHDLKHSVQKAFGRGQIKTRNKECRISVRDESSVYFNVTAKHVWHLVATVYKPTVPCMITIELSDIWLISEAIYHLIFTQDPLNWSLESPPQHRDDFVMPRFLYRVKKQPKMLTLVKICICAT